MGVANFTPPAILILALSHFVDACRHPSSFQQWEPAGAVCEGDDAGSSTLSAAPVCLDCYLIICVCTPSLGFGVCIDKGPCRHATLTYSARTKALQGCAPRSACVPKGLRPDRNALIACAHGMQQRSEVVWCVLAEVPSRRSWVAETVRQRRHDRWRASCGQQANLHGTLDS